MEDATAFPKISILLVHGREEAAAMEAALKSANLLNELRLLGSSAELLEFLQSAETQRTIAAGQSYLVLMNARLLPPDRWRWLQRLNACAEGRYYLILIVRAKEEADMFRADPALNFPFLVQPVSFESISRALAASKFGIGLVQPPPDGGPAAERAPGPGP